MVQIFGSSFAWMDLVFHTVQTSHHECREAQVGVGHWIWEARFNAATFVRSNVRNANRSRTVAARVSQLHRGFKSRHQTLVAVGGGVGDGVQCTSVLDDAANVVQREV